MLIFKYLFSNGLDFNTIEIEMRKKNKKNYTERSFPSFILKNIILN